jgi:hypothetical protein
MTGLMYPKTQKKHRNKHRHISNPKPTKNDICIICGRSYAETHEVYFGDSALRNNSIKYKAQEKLCYMHHRTNKNAVHRDREFDLLLKRKHQRRLESEGMTRTEFIQIFRRSYL